MLTRRLQGNTRFLWPERVWGTPPPPPPRKGHKGQTRGNSVFPVFLRQAGAAWREGSEEVQSVWHWDSKGASAKSGGPGKPEPSIRPSVHPSIPAPHMPSLSQARQARCYHLFIKPCPTHAYILVDGDPTHSTNTQHVRLWERGQRTKPSRGQTPPVRGLHFAIFLCRPGTMTLAGLIKLLPPDSETLEGNK